MRKIKKREEKRIKKERKRSEREIKTKKFLHSKGKHQKSEKTIY